MEMWALGISVTVGIAFIGSVFWFGNWHGKVNEKLTHLSNTVDKIWVHLIGKQTTLPSSPIRLTELGQEISDKLDVAAWAKKEAGKFYDEVSGKDAFQIQEISFAHAATFEPHENLLRGMRKMAFDRGLNMEGVRDVFGIELRDVLLDHRGLHESELDNHETDADPGT